MDLTTRYVTDSRNVIAEVEAVDTTNPDLPRPKAAALITRATEMLRTMSDHAERLGQSAERLRAERDELEGQVRALHDSLAQAHAQAEAEAQAQTEAPAAA